MYVEYLDVFRIIRVCIVFELIDLFIYLQVAWKLEETRKYYDMYNTLDTTLNFLQKEVKLLNSISENFHEAMKSSQSKLEFSKQFESIVQGVEVIKSISFILHYYSVGPDEILDVRMLSNWRVLF